MRTIYLIRQPGEDGSTSEDRPLVQVSGQEWYRIARESLALPKDRRRYFIRDVIAEGGSRDVAYIEVSQEEYRQWRRDTQIARRNRISGSRYTFQSLDAPLRSGTENLSVGDTVGTAPDAEEVFFSRHLLEELQQSLEEWKPWGKELLARYLAGGRRSSTKWLAETCGVTEQTARRYKKEFEGFVKRFLQTRD